MNSGSESLPQAIVGVEYRLRLFGVSSCSQDHRIGRSNPKVERAPEEFGSSRLPFLGEFSVPHCFAFDRIGATLLILREQRRKQRGNHCGHRFVLSLIGIFCHGENTHDSPRV